jgi:hypothetical protein
LSDWVVAWRCYVLFGRRIWMAWFGMIGFIATTGKFPHFSSPINCNADSAAAIATYVASIHGVNFVWAPIYLANNTLMSALIVSKIMCVACQAGLPRSLTTHGHSKLHKQTQFRSSRSVLVTVGRAVVESALVSWIGVLLLLVFHEVNITTVCVSDTLGLALRANGCTDRP